MDYLGPILVGAAGFITHGALTRLVMDPWKKNRETVGQIRAAAMMWTNVIVNPAGESDGDLRMDAYRELRRLGAELAATSWQLRWLPVGMRRSKAKRVMRILTGLGNEALRPDVDNAVGLEFLVELDRLLKLEIHEDGGASAKRLIEARRRS